MSGPPRSALGCPPAPAGFFDLTPWRAASDTDAAESRARWAADLEAKGIRTVEQTFNGYVRLCREGEEAISEYGLRERRNPRAPRRHVRTHGRFSKLRGENP